MPTWRDRIWGTSDVPLFVKPGTWRGVPASAQIRNLGDLMRGGPRVPTVNCMSCGSVVPGNASFCPHCGGQIAPARQPSYSSCPQCGTPNEMHSRFCVQCGYPLRS
jgi:ribosomal protein L40E